MKITFRKDVNGSGNVRYRHEEFPGIFEAAKSIKEIEGRIGFMRKDITMHSKWKQLELKESMPRMATKGAMRSRNQILKKCLKLNSIFR